MDARVTSNTRMRSMNPFAAALALAQGWWIRRRIELLPPAPGPTSGAVGTARAGQVVRLGVIGESTAAGCGVLSHGEGFAGALAEKLAASGGSVEWTVVGEDGATARRIRYRLMPRLVGDFDVVVVLAGVNDVLARRSPADWCDDLAAILSELTARSRRVIVTGTPPFVAFPSLPTTLAHYLDDRGRQLDSVSRAVCAVAPDAVFVGSEPGLVGDGFFARDGFHPAERGYRRWAELAAEALA